MAGEIVPRKKHTYTRNGPQKRDLGEQVLDRRNRGETIPMIAAALDISEASAYRYMEYALSLRLPLTIDKFREQQNDALDRTERENEENIAAIEKIANLALERGDADGALKAIAQRQNALMVRMRIAERRAKLNGLDAPVKVDANVTVVSPEEAELAEIMRRAREQREADRNAE